MHKIPTSLSLAKAASFPLPGAHALYALIDIAQFTAGKSVFINDAASDFGQALIQLVQQLGGEVFISLTTDHDRTWFMEKYKLPAGKVFDGNSGTWTPRILAATEGKGLDIAINNGIGTAVRSLSAAKAKGGHFVDAKQQVDPLTLAPKVFERNIDMSVLDFRQLPDCEVYSLIEKTLGLLQTGRLKQTRSPPTYLVSELADAVAVMQHELSTPAVITSLEDATAPMLPSPPPPLQISPEGTYILAGGLGALGLTIADMIRHGARHLVLLSRSGASSPRQIETLQKFRHSGCAVDVVKCDVTDTAQVNDLAMRVQKNGRNLKGIIQLAMVLRISITIHCRGCAH